MYGFEDENYFSQDGYEERRQRRAQRRALREKKRRRMLLIRNIILGVFVFVILLTAGIIIFKHIDRSGILKKEAKTENPVQTGDVQAVSTTETLSSNTVQNAMIEVETPVTVGSDDSELENIEEAAPLNVIPDDNTVGVGEDVVSEYAILVSLEENRVVAAKNCRQKMYPASMTKVMTVLVAAEQLKSEASLDDIVEISNEIEAFSYENGCSNVGFTPGERVTVRDLFYGTILPSGADAAMALAEYTAGSQEGFVDMMNAKAEELGLSKTTHFMNCIGIYDDNNYTTAADMAVIMNAAMKNAISREALSRHTYTTISTSQHPDGITVSNWFLRRIEDKQETGIVIGAKTGFVNQSKNCAVSYAESDEGSPYICVTGASSSSWRCIFDHVDIYTNIAFK